MFVIEQPPRLRALRNGAILLLPQPLLLCQGGESPRFAIVDSSKLTRRVLPVDSHLQVPAGNR
jgi:hypothetical protein